MTNDQDWKFNVGILLKKVKKPTITVTFFFVRQFSHFEPINSSFPLFSFFYFVKLWYQPILPIRLVPDNPFCITRIIFWKQTLKAPYHFFLEASKAPQIIIVSSCRSCFFQWCKNPSNSIIRQPEQNDWKLDASLWRTSWWNSGLLSTIHPETLREFWWKSRHY